ncbi:asparagine synthase (glutamine-hydrolyzing) [Flagellimonas sp.]|uniref:asparagine synthase (glutamine-hydrolyzing) n=1 Tax=Flagellimonas sp. TaxID=2058762 RepID=UPI003AB84938
MCGIAGSYSVQALARKNIANALSLLGHRGPDANGVHQSRLGNSHICMVHTRLSIIDLEARANQPFERDGIVIAFNGEIYNYKELAEQLREIGVRLYTDSDTEVLLEAYRVWGIDCLDKFEGMWAFALLDKGRGKFFLCRDRFGEKPLFFHKNNNGITFASEPKAIEALLGHKLNINMDHVCRYLVNGFRSLHKTQDTFFDDVEELAPASVLEIDSCGLVRTFRYWELSYMPADMSEEYVVSTVREKLVKSVSLRLRSDVPLAFCLSGGIDSGALVSIASKVLSHDVHAFSVIDSDERYDESQNISTVVDVLGCKHFIARTSTDGFFERMSGLVSYHDAPVPTISYYMHSFLSEEIKRQGFTVALSGTGADEIFTGYYDHYLFWLSTIADKAKRENAIEHWKTGYGRWVNNPMLQDPELFVREPDFRGHIYQNTELFNGFLRRPFNEAFSEEVFTDDVLRNRMMNELRHEIVPVILRADDMNSMRFSLENRSPFLDRDLVEFAFTIPNHLLFDRGVAKQPLRQAIKGILPESVRTDTRKRGFNASIDSLVNRNDPKTKEILLGDSPIFDIVDRSALENFLRADLTDNSFSKFLFYFISAKMFLETRI